MIVYLPNIVFVDNGSVLNNDYTRISPHNRFECYGVGEAEGVEHCFLVPT